MKRILASLVLSLVPAFAFASGSVETLSLAHETRTTMSHICEYVKELNLGSKANLSPIQVYGMLEGAYHLLERQTTLIPKPNGTLTIQLYAYQEVAANLACPATAELLVVK